MSTAGPTMPDRVTLALAYLAMPLKRRVRRLDRVLVPLRVQCGSTVRRLSVSSQAEMSVLREIFVEGMYDVDTGGSVATVVDLGANIGAASLRFADAWPDARIIAVEPDPSTLFKLRANVRDVPQITVIDAAVVAHESPHVGFVIDPSSWTSHVAIDGDSGTTMVTALTLEQLFEKAELDDVDVMKIDIEGLEHEVLPATNVLDRVDMIIGEVHPTARPGEDAELLDALVARGWTWVKPLEHHTFCLRAPV
jgi:FkbM family methyltransferase